MPVHETCIQGSRLLLLSVRRGTGSATFETILLDGCVQDMLTIVSVGFWDGNLAECVANCRKDRAAIYGGDAI